MVPKLCFCHRSPAIALLPVPSSPSYPLPISLPPPPSSAAGLLHAIGAGDGRAAARAVLRFSTSPQEVCNTDELRAAFGEDMHTLFLERCRGFGTNVQFGSVLRGVLNLVRVHRISIEANYMTLVMNVLCLEGMAGALLPQYNVLDAARPLLAAHRLLPRRLFIAAMPLVRQLKEIRDAAWMRKTRGGGAGGGEGKGHKAELEV